MAWSASLAHSLPDHSDEQFCPWSSENGRAMTEGDEVMGGPLNMAI